MKNKSFIFLLSFILLNLIILFGCEQKMPHYNGFPLPEEAKIIKTISDENKENPVFIDQVIFRLSNPIQSDLLSSSYYQTIMENGWKDEHALEKMGEYRFLFSKEERLIEVSTYSDKLTITEYNSELFWNESK